jgi:peptidoglycan hydrolase-like protein with peptidoglycan-binding domain
MKKIFGFSGIAIVTLSGMFTFNTPVVEACSAIHSTPSENFNISDAVFTGKVVSVTSGKYTTTIDANKNVEMNSVTAIYEVQKYWKGEVGEKITVVSSALADYTCSPFTPILNASYLIYSIKDKLNNTYTVSDSRGIDLLYAGTDLAFLGSGKSPFPTPTQNKPSYKFLRNLSVGVSGDDVTNLQTLLIDKGFDIPAISSGLSNKGYFGSQTKIAVSKFQASVGIPNTGFIGPLTREKLNENINVTISNLVVTSPVGGEKWEANSNHRISWGYRDLDSNSKVDIYLFNPATCTQFNVMLPVYPACQQSYTTLDKNIKINTNYDWIVATDIANKPIPAGDYKVLVCKAGTYECNTNASIFSITKANSPITVTSPKSDESWLELTKKDIAWTAPQYFRATYVDIRLTTPQYVCGSYLCPLTAYPLHTIATNVSVDQHSYNWNVGEIKDTTSSVGIAPPGRYTIEICETGTTVCASSDTFGIVIPLY